MTGRHRRRPPGRGHPPGRHSFRRAAEAEADHFRLIRLRTVLLFITLALGVGGLSGRLITLHIVQAGVLEQIAARQQAGEMVLEPRRGRLLDRSGRPLAVNIEVESVYAVPSKITDPDAFARAVAPALGLKPAEVISRLEPARHFVWLARKVSPDVASTLRAKRLGDQIGFLFEARRRYPNDALAAHLLGFAGIDSQGLAGAELAFERYLQGRAGRARFERDALGRPRLETRAVVLEPVDGADVVLTIDQVLQHIAEREVDRAVDASRALAGAVLMMDPETGEMLAMAFAPRFSPNAYDRAKPALWNNPALSSVYEPGSTFKIFLAAAALESGAVREDEIFLNTGALPIPGGYVVREARGRKYPRQTLGEIIRQSSNVGAAMVATRLGADRYHAAIRRFGFGEPTGIDLPGEIGGLVPHPSQWQGGTLQTMGFGQGISVTPLQLLAAATALARDGVLVRPHVLRAVRDAEGRSLEVTMPAPGRAAVSAATARRVLAMMAESVERGTGTQARVEGFPVAGKTGTAQKPAPTGGYLADGYVASFVGIVPADRPRLAILVLLDEPKGDYFGGLVAAPLFREVATQALWHLRVTPAAAR